MFFIVLALILLGLCFGSFVNASVWRLHKQEEMEEERALHPWRVRLKQTIGTMFGRVTDKRDDYSILTGRSMCSRCKHPLHAIDLIPLFSWVALRGKCRYCHKPIADSPLVELLLPVAFIFSYIFWPMPLTQWYDLVNFGVWLVMLVMLAILFVYDLRWYILPDKIVAPLIVLAVANAILQFVTHQPYGPLLETIQYHLYGLLPITGLYWLIYLFSKGKKVGLGDVKLGIFIGLALGWQKTLLTLMLANVFGLFVVVPLLLARKLKRTSRIPFGPMLISAFFIAGIWGDRIINWYLSIRIGY